MSHTAGPWSAVDDEILAADGDVRVANVPLCDGTNPTEWQANARLIAAAPDMLEALKVAQLWLENCIPVTHIEGPTPLPLIAAALAKAEAS